MQPATRASSLPHLPADVRRTPAPRRGWLLLLMLLLAAPVQAQVRAWFDRETVTLGETVTLNVEVDGMLGSAPDLSALMADFRIGATSSSAQMSMAGGRSSARTLWAVVLEPRTEGVIGVPALTIAGERTEPLTLTVLPAPRGSSAAAGDDVFLEVEAGTLDPYVQQQVRYTVRLFYAVQLLEGQLEEPQPDGARLQRLGNDGSYQRVVAGRRYQVVERQYLLSAERSGALEIPPPRFRGRSTGAGIFGRGGGVLQATGDVVALEVRPRPAGGPRPWLPAERLELQDESPGLPERLRVGEPVTVAVRLAAHGLLAEQLPELQLPAIDGAQVYPDRENSQTTEHSGGVVGERTRSFAIVPAAPGVLELPALRIGWWNTLADRAEVAELPARRIDVLPAAGAAVGPVATGAAGAAADGEPPAGTARPDSPDPWQLATAVLLLLWLATLGWALRRRRPAVAAAAAEPPVAVRPPLAPALPATLAAGDPAAIAAALRGACPRPCGEGLDAVAGQLADPQQADAVRALERALYADGDREAAIGQLRRAFAGGPRWQPPGAAPADDGLPPLYR
jgi:hypothetical protein